MKLRNLLFISTLLLLLAGSVSAETTAARDSMRHEVRVAVGDMLFETLMWHNDVHRNYLGSPDRAYTERQHFCYTPHIGAEYQYRINRWLGVGALVDFQYTAWENRTYNNLNQLTATSDENFYNLTILPTVRFTYLHTEYVSLYSSLALGMNINGGTETDIYGKKTAVGAAFDIGALGITVGHGHWFGSAELGGMFALKNTATIYMLASRIVSVSVGYTF